MKYLKTFLVTGSEVSRLNDLISAGPNDEEEGQHLGGFTVAFDNGFYITIDVINYAAGPAITARLCDHNDAIIGREEMIPGGVDQDFAFEFLEDNYRVTVERAATATLTPAAIKAYLEAGGGSCPYCTSTDIDQSPVRMDIGNGVCRVTCMACEAVWEDHLTLTGIVGLDGPAQNVGRTAPVSDSAGDQETDA